MAERPNRRAIGTLSTAAPSSTSPKLRKPNSPYCMAVSRVKLGGTPARAHGAEAFETALARARALL